MITAFSVKLPVRQSGLRGWAERLRRDRVEVKTARARGVTLRHVIYTSYSGAVKLEKTDGAVGAARSRLLCSDKLEFPPNSGYRRFCDGGFSERLCENFALSALDCCPNAADLRVAIYDPEARHADFLLSVLERCGDVTVVTDCATPYYSAATRALDELGAAAMITGRRKELENRALIIAPHPIAEELPVRRDAVVLTAGKPRAKVGGEVFWRYRFKMPNGFSDIKPDELSEEYFCSALYTLGAQYELGSILPLSAEGNRAAKAEDILFSKSVP